MPGMNGCSTGLWKKTIHTGSVEPPDGTAFTLDRQNALTSIVRKADMPTPKLTAEIITAAIEGFEAQKRHIDTQIAELRALMPGGTAETAATPEPATRKRKKFSAASRRKMALAQKARWAKIRGEAESSAPATPKATKPKRRISREGLARIIAATKKRWRLQKAAAKAATKKPAPARKKAAVKKAAARTAPAKAAKKAPPLCWRLPFSRQLS